MAHDHLLARGTRKKSLRMRIIRHLDNEFFILVYQNSVGPFKTHVENYRNQNEKHSSKIGTSVCKTALKIFEKLILITSIY